MSEKSERGKLVELYLEKYPLLPSMTIARMVHGAHPNKFKDPEHVRDFVRRFRGTHGQQHRGDHDDKFFLPEPTFNNPLSLPSALSPTYADYYVPRELERGLFICDLHIPYHDKVVLELIINYGKTFNPDFIVLLGDMMDCYLFSVFRKDPTKPEIVKEVQLTRQFLTSLRVHFPNALIIWDDGNHEERWRTYMMLHAPELFKLEETRLDVILGLNTLGIEYVGDKRRIRCGKLTCVHGHEFWQSINNPVNPARGLFLKAKASSVCAHFHQTSEHTEPTIRDEVVTCWSIGCACHLHPEYMPINRWNHGFATIDKQSSGNFTFRNYRIIDGELV